MAGWVINRDSVSSDLLQGEVVAIHLGTGIYYSMRGTAATIWQALAAPATIPAVAAVVASAHEVGAAEAAEAVKVFLDRLRDEQLVIEDGSVAPVALTPPGARQPYAAPVLERFSDLQDLLLLDPIHDVGAQGWPHRPAADPS